MHCAFDIDLILNAFTALQNHWETVYKLDIYQQVCMIKAKLRDSPPNPRPGSKP